MSIQRLLLKRKMLTLSDVANTFVDDVSEMDELWGEGNQNRDLWKAVCHAMAKDVCRLLLKDLSLHLHLSFHESLLGFF